MKLFFVIDNDTNQVSGSRPTLETAISYAKETTEISSNARKSYYICEGVAIVRKYVITTNKIEIDMEAFDETNP